MTAYEQLVEKVISNNVHFFTVNPSSEPAAAIKVGDIYGIFLDEKKFDADAARRVALAHEKGHCDTGTFCIEATWKMNHDRYERVAWKSAVYSELPYERLRAALHRARTAEGVDLWDVSEELGLTYEFVVRAIETYETAGKRIIV